LEANENKNLAVKFSEIEKIQEKKVFSKVALKEYF